MSKKNLTEMTEEEAVNQIIKDLDVRNTLSDVKEALDLISDIRRKLADLEVILHRQILLR